MKQGIDSIIQGPADKVFELHKNDEIIKDKEKLKDFIIVCMEEQVDYIVDQIESRSENL